MCKVKTHLYDKHTSWVKSPWNYVNFLLEYPLNSLNLELVKMCEPCNLFLAKVRESQGTWVPKSQGESGNFAKKTALKPWSDVTQFCRIHRGKILFSKSKLTNLKNFGWFFQKSIYILKPPCLEFFWYSPYSAKEAWSVLRVFQQAIKIRVT